MSVNPSKITIREISKKIAKDMIVKNHYSHKWTSCRYALGVFYETDNEHQFFDEKDEKLAGIENFLETLLKLFHSVFHMSIFVVIQ